MFLYQFTSDYKKNQFLRKKYTKIFGDIKYPHYLCGVKLTQEHEYGRDEVLLQVSASIGDN